MTFAETRVSLFDEGDLLRRKGNRLGGGFLLQLQQAFVFAAHAMLGQDVLHGGRTDADPLEPEHIAQLYAAPTRMLQA